MTSVRNFVTVTMEAIEFVTVTIVGAWLEDDSIDGVAFEAVPVAGVVLDGTIDATALGLASTDSVEEVADGSTDASLEILIVEDAAPTPFEADISAETDALASADVATTDEAAAIELSVVDELVGLSALMLAVELATTNVVLSD